MWKETKLVCEKKLECEKIKLDCEKQNWTLKKNWNVKKTGLWKKTKLVCEKKTGLWKNKAGLWKIKLDSEPSGLLIVKQILLVSTLGNV